MRRRWSRGGHENSNEVYAARSGLRGWGGKERRGAEDDSEGEKATGRRCCSPAAFPSLLYILPIALTAISQPKNQTTFRAIGQSTPPPFHVPFPSGGCGRTMAARCRPITLEPFHVDIASALSCGKGPIIVCTLSRTEASGTAIPVPLPVSIPVSIPVLLQDAHAIGFHSLLSHNSVSSGSQLGLFRERRGSSQVIKLIDDGDPVTDWQSSSKASRMSALAA